MVLIAEAQGSASVQCASIQESLSSIPRIFPSRRFMQAWCTFSTLHLRLDCHLEEHNVLLSKNKSMLVCFIGVFLHLVLLYSMLSTPLRSYNRAMRKLSLGKWKPLDWLLGSLWMGDRLFPPVSSIATRHTERLASEKDVHNIFFSTGGKKRGGGQIGVQNGSNWRRHTRFSHFISVNKIGNKTG